MTAIPRPRVSWTAQAALVVLLLLLLAVMLFGAGCATGGSSVRVYGVVWRSSCSDSLDDANAETLIEGGGRPSLQVPLVGGK